MAEDPPYLDTHTITVALGPDEVWRRTRAYAERLASRLRPFFAIVEEVPGERVALAGRHLFARYRLVFEVEARTAERTTLLHAVSYAEFPGLHGRVYRALVVGTRFHVLATRGMLRRIARA